MENRVCSNRDLIPTFFTFKKTPLRMEIVMAMMATRTLIAFWPSSFYQVFPALLIG